MPNSAETSLGPKQKPRKVSQRQKDSFCSQAFGARQALLALIPLVKDGPVREAIMEIGCKTDEVVAENGGILFRTFKQAVESIEEMERDGEPT